MYFNEELNITFTNNNIIFLVSVKIDIEKKVFSHRDVLVELPTHRWHRIGKLKSTHIRTHSYLNPLRRK